MNNNYDIQFAKYEFAKYSFNECNHFLKLHEQLRDSAESKHSFDTMVATAFVVTYARPFGNSNKEYHGFKMGAISDKWKRKLSQKHQEAHNYLIGTGRNALAAHIDLGKLMPNIFIKDGKNVDFIFDLHLPYINSNALELYRELVSAAISHCFEKQNELKPNLSSDHLIPEVSHPDASSFIKRKAKFKENT
jgi:hypothetical protein